MAVGDVAGLGVGDIIPLEVPRSLAVLVDGRRIADLPAAEFGAGLPETDR
jgi:hypothetical protein